MNYATKCALLLCCAFGFQQVSIAQDTCNGRYESSVFSVVEYERDVLYGHNTTFDGKEQDLLLDVYQPMGDTVQARPLLVMMHGGAFLFGNKRSGMLPQWSEELAQRGYVVASINYRLGYPEPRQPTSVLEASVRAIQDGKAAVRFFRRYAEQYRIDTSQIFVWGMSAGAYTALHLAYLQEREVPFFLNLAKLGGLEGESGNPGFSSAVHGVVNMWGALTDTTWIEKGDVPVVSVHGTADTVVPYNVGLVGGVLPQYGSMPIYHRAQHLGIRSELLLFTGAGHSLDDDPILLDSSKRIAMQFLYSILRCNNIPTTTVASHPTGTPYAFRIAPNPATEVSVAQFFVPTAQEVTVALCDALGREQVVLFRGLAVGGSTTVPLRRVDGGRLAAGVYYCRLTTSSGVQTVPVVVR